MDYTTEQQAENALRWIGREGDEGLLSGRKTTFLLVCETDTGESHCCLGRGCMVVGIDPRGDNAYLDFQAAVGLLQELGDAKDGAELHIDGTKCLTGLNDNTFAQDTDFRNIRAIIIDRAEDLFLPHVAAGIRKQWPKEGQTQETVK